MTVTSTTSDEPIVLRTPAWSRYLSLVGTFFLGVVAALFVLMTILLLFKSEWALAILFAALSVFIAGLTGYVLRDLRGRWGIRVALFPDHAILDLPAGRSLIHRPNGQRLTVRYREIAALETRYEAFRSLGLATMQQPFVMKLKNGESIFLFEDRGLASGIAQPMYAPFAEALAERAHVPVKNIGMVEGKGGLLAVWGTDAPDWSAPSLPRDQQLRLWRHAATTGSFAILVIVAAFMIRALF